jgi:hypothetical protein
MISLYRLHVAHLEWLGIRSTLKGQEHRHFERWLCRAYSEIVPKDIARLTHLRQQCREVHRGVRPPPDRTGLSMTTLKRHAEALTTRYLLVPTPRPTFADFLEDVLKKCLTEDALKRFLSSSSIN